MKFFKNIVSGWRKVVAAWRNLFRKRRINMLNATDNSEEWHIHLSPATLFAAFVSFVLLLFIIVLTLVAYTPVLEILPGYRTEADRARLNLIQNIIRVDSIERMMNDMLTYNQNIALIMEGKTPVTRILSSADSARITKVLVMPSPEDSLLRAQMEGAGEYALAARGTPVSAVREAIELQKPIDGIILNRFNIKDGNFGVRIAAAANDRVTAVDQGTVTLNLWTPETGYIVQVQHAGSLLSIYKGLSNSLVNVGQTIRRGELVGYNSIVENGEVRPFEFELWNNGKPVDPESYIIF